MTVGTFERFRLGMGRVGSQDRDYRVALLKRQSLREGQFWARGVSTMHRAVKALVSGELLDFAKVRLRLFCVAGGRELRTGQLVQSLGC